MTTTQDALNAYAEAWHEKDAAKRKALLESCWATNATYEDPNGKAEGRDGLIALIEGFQSTQPNDRIAFTSQAAQHGPNIYFSWHMVAEDGSEMVAGVDFGEIGEDGLITKLVGFFGDPPAL